MKKLKLIFGLLVIAAFIGTTVLDSFTNDNDEARRKRPGTILPSNG